ncbi:unnamed protein product [Porites lobata]|uniref:Mutator-like transposase domain-containing protein n=1 Tax=Porites lobata TaxID=104759 RepID=A0ABN8RH31_9CNID|nr:unnamed protein product [Porites lobata]
MMRLSLGWVVFCILCAAIRNVERNVTRRYVNALLTSINLPAVGQNTLKARERDVGAAIETVARNSCLEGLQLEKDCRRTVDTEQVVKIGVSYDMSTQKKGKGHNTLTGEGSMIGLSSGKVVG